MSEIGTIITAAIGRAQLFALVAALATGVLGHLRPLTGWDAAAMEIGAALVGASAGWIGRAVAAIGRRWTWAARTEGPDGSDRGHDAMGHDERPQPREGSLPPWSRTASKIEGRSAVAKCEGEELRSRHIPTDKPRIKPRPHRCFGSRID